jgi:hypothetical protein
MIKIWLIGCSVLILLIGHWVHACSTCLAGDPTLTLMGTEKSYSGRLRIAGETLYRTETIGEANVNQSKLREQRFTLGLAYAWNERLNLAIRLPLIHKRLEYISLATEQTTGIGDVELVMKYTLSDQEKRHKHLFGVLAGLRLPTASEQKNRGESLDIDVQPGIGAWVPQAGVWYGRYRFPWFFYASSVIHLATEGFQDFQAGTAVVTTFMTQYALNYNTAIQLGLDTRWSEHNQFADQADPDSGGWLALLSPGLVIKIAEDMLCHLVVSIPTLENLSGHHEEGTIVQLGITYDF